MAPKLFVAIKMDEADQIDSAKHCSIDASNQIKLLSNAANDDKDELTVSNGSPNETDYKEIIEDENLDGAVEDTNLQENNHPNLANSPNPLVSEQDMQTFSVAEDTDGFQHLNDKNDDGTTLCVSESSDNVSLSVSSLQIPPKELTTDLTEKSASSDKEPDTSEPDKEGILDKVVQAGEDDMATAEISPVSTHEVENISEDSDAPLENPDVIEQEKSNISEPHYVPVSPVATEILNQIDDISDAEDEPQQVEKSPKSTMKAACVPKKSVKVMELKNMIEDIEEGELDYEEEGEVADVPELPEYVSKKEKEENVSEEGEIMSDKESDDDREEGEIKDDDETGQVYICVDPVNDRWKKVSREEQKRLQEELEDGQIEDDVVDELPLVQSTSPTQQHGRFIPRTLCKYFNNGLCRWGSTCRFLHPGINDKGIPTDIQPTWNATAGNYAMHRPPGMYPSALGKPSVEVTSSNSNPPSHSDHLTSAYDEQEGYLGSEALAPGGLRKESAWEKGIRRAKEVKEAAARRRVEDSDFEQKRMSMRIPEQNLDNESDFEPGADPALSAERTLNEWSLSESAKPSNEFFDRRKDDRRYDRVRLESKTDLVDKSSGRARLATLPPSHPIRREERQRQREREKRERDDKERREREKEIEPVYKPKPKPEVSDPRTKLYDTKVKAMGATDWVDPWMRTQPQAPGFKPEVRRSSIEAISDSSSSSSDSDSDSDSSSSDKSSDSSDSSEVERKKKLASHLTLQPSSDVGEPKNRKERREQYRQHTETRNSLEKNEPLSYKEWKRLQTTQKAQHHQQSANQYKHVPSREEAGKTEATLQRVPTSQRMSTSQRLPTSQRVAAETRPLLEEKRFSYQHDPRSINTLSKRPPVTKHPKPVIPSSPKPMNMGNDDKFDSPKRKTATDSDSDSASDTDSSDSDSESSDSDSDDSDSDSDSDDGMKAKLLAAAPAKQSYKPPPMDTTARKDIKIQINEKPKATTEESIISLAGAKRPVARKDELLKELKAVEDAIARKRAKID